MLYPHENHHISPFLNGFFRHRLRFLSPIDIAEISPWIIMFEIYHPSPYIPYNPYVWSVESSISPLSSSSVCEYMLNILTGWWFQTLWKIWARQLGWWHSQLNGKSYNFMFQTTNQYGDIVVITISFYMKLPSSTINLYY
jgi:hypothetical protein